MVATRTILRASGEGISFRTAGRRMMDVRESAFTHVPAGQGEVLQVTGGAVTCKLSGRRAGSAYSLWETGTAPGKGPRPHRHHGQDEDFYVLEGEVRFVSGEESVTVRPGDFVRVPSDTVHSYTVTSAEPCCMLIVLTPPGGIEDFWHEIGIPISDPSAPPPPPGSTNFDEIARIARRHGTEFVDD
jgi:mannose-6-phosphate isomerase-like protein (cupin superfamily)